nr:hypothetical protein [Sinorhizobium meliloti]
MKGLYLAAGCSGHGFGLGPGIGRLAADLVETIRSASIPHPSACRASLTVQKSKWVQSDWRAERT